MALFTPATAPDPWWAVVAGFVSLIVTLGVFAGLWVAGSRKRDCSIVDLYWAFGFAVIAVVETRIGGRTDPAALLMLALVVLWAGRLGTHLAARHLRAEEEDPRYRAMRERNGADWPTRSFWMVFMVQGVCMWLIATPVHAVLLNVAGWPLPAGVAAALLGLGVAAFAAGFILEAVADAALARFRADPANRGRLLTSGLFARTRHPNYLGECLVWWGLGLVAFALTGQPVALLGPAFLNLLLVKVSGVPPLEEHLSSRPGFAEYAASTPAILPRLWPRPRQGRVGRKSA